MEDVAVADGRRAADCDVVGQHVARAQRYAGADVAEGADAAVGADLGGGVDECQGVDLAHDNCFWPHHRTTVAAG